MSRRIDKKIVKELYVKYLQETKRGFQTQWNMVEEEYEKLTGQWFSRDSLKNHIKDLDAEVEYKKRVEQELSNPEPTETETKTIKSELKEKVISNMTSLGVYREEYEDIIDIYVNMLHRLKMLYEEFEASGYEVETEYTNKAGATNQRKTPLYLSIEKLENDIVTYSDRLCLNPKAVGNIVASNEPTSKLDQVMAKIGDRYS